MRITSGTRSAPELRGAWELGQRALHRVTTVCVCGLLHRILGLRIGEQVAELSVAVTADRLVQRDRCLDCAERLLDMLQLETCRRRELLLGRRRTGRRLEALTRARELDAPLVHVRRDTDRGRLVRDRTLTRLANPPSRVGRELVAAAPVELL